MTHGKKNSVVNIIIENGILNQDEMNDNEFNKMMEIRYNQAKAGERKSVDESFDKIRTNI